MLYIGERKKVADLNTFVYWSNRTSRVLLSWSYALQDRNMLEVASIDVNMMQLGFFPIEHYRGVVFPFL